MPLLKPVRLDPYQRIVNVGWAGVDILVLELSYQRNGPRPAFTLRDLPFTSTSYDLFDSVIVNNDGAGNPAVGNPITSDMLKFLRLWNRPPYLRTIEGSNRGNALLFFNLRKIRAGLPPGTSTFTLKIDTPGTGGGRTETGTTYYVWLPFVSWEEALEHPGLWIDSIWGNAAEAEARLANLSGGGGQSSAYVIIIAEQGRWYTAIIRPLLAAPVVIYFWKAIVWDKVLGLGSTDPLTGMVADWSGMIITAYVGGRSIEKVARVFARRL